MSLTPRRARSSRGRVVLALAFPAAGGAAADDLDWCAPIVVRPTERIEDTKTCRWIWSKDEIARQAEIVYLREEGHGQRCRRAPAPDDLLR